MAATASGRPPWLLVLVAALLGALGWSTLVVGDLGPPRPRAFEPGAPSTGAVHRALDAAMPEANWRLDGARLVSGARDGCALTLTPVARAPATALSSRHLSLVDESQRCGAWTARAGATLRELDIWPDGLRPGSARGRPVDSSPGWLLLATASIGALLGVGLLGLWLLTRMHGPAALGLGAGAWLAALGLRLLWPAHGVLVHFGYQLAGHAWSLDRLPRYGPGGVALHGALQPIVGSDDSAIFALHAGLGALTCTLLAAVSWRAAGRLAGVATWVLLATAPLLLRDHRSESLHVPALTALAVAACALAVPELDRRARGLRSAALALGVLVCGLLRSDAVLPAVATVAALAATLRPAGPTARLGSWRWLLALMALSATPPLLWAVSEAARDAHAGNLPQVSELISSLPGHLLHNVVLWRADWLSPVVWLPIVVVVAKPSAASARVGRWGWLLGAAVLWTLPSFLDFNETSLPRLQAPAAITLLTVAGLLTGTLLQRLPGVRRRALGAAGALLIWGVGAMAADAPWRGRDGGNAAQEEALLRKVEAHLRDRADPQRPFLLALRSYADIERADLHMHLPTWRFQPPALPGKVISATDGLELLHRMSDAGPDAPDLYFVRSVRCWLGPAADAPSVEARRCRALHEHPDMQPVFEQEVANLGETRTFHRYGRAANLQLGLYRRRAEPREGARPTRSRRAR